MWFHRYLEELLVPRYKCKRVGHKVGLVVRPTPEVLGLFNETRQGTSCKRCGQAFTVYGLVREL